MLALSIASICLSEGFLAASSLELGHVRARSRGWAELDRAPAQAGQADEGQVPPGASSAPAQGQGEQRADLPNGVEPMQEGSRKSGLRLISGLVGAGQHPRRGYLVRGSPPSLRFSDLDPAHSKPPASALPEFSFAPQQHYPYLVEAELPEDALNNPALLSEIVVDLEPHAIVSGKIETRIITEEEKVEDFNLDEQRTTVLRPEEVLIFFEADTGRGASGTVVPFSPATPSAAPTIKSSATITEQ